MSFDIYQEITNRIIKQLEQGSIPWRKPWKVSTSQKLYNVAFNRVTKTAYSLLNQMLLSKPGEYASFKQWQDLGGKIKKGAKAEIVVFWKWLEYEKDKKTENEEEEKEIKKIPFLRYLQVFHIDDVENVQPLKLKENEILKDFESEEKAEEIILNYIEREQIQLCYGGDRAYYQPSTDKIQLPPKNAFNGNASEFYSTAFHEIVHSTGAQNRLDRLSKTAYFGSTEYSQEELVAEIGACGLLSMLNLETQSSFKNNSAYIQSWLKVLQNDKKLIVYASSKAEKAIDFILNGNTDRANN